MKRFLAIVALAELSAAAIPPTPARAYMRYQAVLMNNNRGGYNLWFK